MGKRQRAVVTAGGSGFGRALTVWLAREGIAVDFSARRPEDIQETCRIVHEEGGIARGYLCDFTCEQSIADFARQLLASETPIDILILNAAQWLSGELGESSSREIIDTLYSGLTGAILITHQLLPAMRRSNKADIVSIISSCAIPNFTDSIAHPAFFASKHGLSGFTNKLSQQLSKENIRVTALYPPDFDVAGLDALVDPQVKMGEQLLDGRSIWETIRFILNQPHNCHIGTVYFQGPTREALLGE